jgi:antitoxin ChpS
MLYFYITISNGSYNMHTTNLRKVGGSIMVAVPPAFLDQLRLQAGAKVGLTLDHGCILVSPNPPPRYTLDELLSKCDSSTKIPEEDREWLDARPLGSELL